MNEEEPVRDVIMHMVEEYLDASERFASLQPKDV
jgi:hypothetical protein